mgnify:CR=1 FL=1
MAGIAVVVHVLVMQLVMMVVMMVEVLVKEMKPGLLTVGVMAQIIMKVAAMMVVTAVHLPV